MIVVAEGHQIFVMVCQVQELHPSARKQSFAHFLGVVGFGSNVVMENAANLVTRDMKLIFRNIILLFISIILYSLLSSIGAFDQRIKAIAFYLCYSSLLIYLRYKKGDWKYVLILYFPLVCIELPLRLYIGFSYDASTIVFSILPAFLAGLILLLLKNKSPRIIYSGAFAGLVFILWFNLLFYYKWVNFCDYGSFTGTPVAHCNIEGTIKALNNSSEPINLKSDSRLLVVDVWNEACGVCYKKFPVFSGLKQKYHKKEEIHFISGLHPVKQNFKDYAREVDSIYSFSTYILNDSLIKRLHVDFYPTVVVIQNGKLVFSGSVELLADFLANQ